MLVVPLLDDTLTDSPSGLEEVLDCFDGVAETDTFWGAKMILP